jgi:hypothetical protein
MLRPSATTLTSTESVCCVKTYRTSSSSESNWTGSVLARYGQRGFVDCHDFPEWRVPDHGSRRQINRLDSLQCKINNKRVAQSETHVLTTVSVAHHHCHDIVAPDGSFKRIVSLGIRHGADCGPTEYNVRIREWLPS